MVNIPSLSSIIVTVSSDESVLSTFPISVSMVQALVDQVCALWNVSAVTALIQEPSLGLQEKFLAALDNAPEQLSALAVVGWETNERYCILLET